MLHCVLCSTDVVLSAAWCVCCTQVDAVVLRFTPLVVPAIKADFNTLETVVKALFHYRRKYIKKATR